MTNNLPKIVKISTKLGAKTSQNLSLELSWRVLEGPGGASWPQEAPRHQKEVRTVRAFPSPNPQDGTKIHQHLSQERSKR